MVTFNSYSSLFRIYFQNTSTWRQVSEAKRIENNLLFFVFKVCPCVQFTEPSLTIL